MSYYVTIRDSSQRRTVFAAGPFNRHGDAERCVGHVRRYVHEHYPNDAAWAGWGTSRVKSGPLPDGRFNEQLGLPTTGRITSSPLPDNRWWTEGDPSYDPPVVTLERQQRRQAKKAA